MTIEFGKTSSMQEMLAAINQAQANDGIVVSAGQSRGRPRTVTIHSGANQSGHKSAFQAHFGAEDALETSRDNAVLKPAAIDEEAKIQLGTEPQTDKAGDSTDPRFVSLASEQTDAVDPNGSFQTFLSAEKSNLVDAAWRRLKDANAGKLADPGDLSLRALTEELLEPLLQKWLSEHLEEIVQRRVEAEVQRISRLNR